MGDPVSPLPPYVGAGISHGVLASVGGGVVGADRSPDAGSARWHWTLLAFGALPG